MAPRAIQRHRGGQRGTENSKATERDRKPKSQAVGRLLEDQPRQKRRPQGSPDPTLLCTDIGSGLEGPTKIANLPEALAGKPGDVSHIRGCLLPGLGSKL